MIGDDTTRMPVAEDAEAGLIGGVPNRRPGAGGVGGEGRRGFGDDDDDPRSGRLVAQATHGGEGFGGKRKSRRAGSGAAGVGVVGGC